MNKSVFIISSFLLFYLGDKPEKVLISTTFTVDSLGACQGVSYQDGIIYLYGDREVGVIRKYRWEDGHLKYTNQELQLTEKGENVINHPTGLARIAGMPVFLGNTVRLNKAGTNWKAYIYQINWEGLNKNKKLDNNILNVIEDDACIQGTRPEYVRVGNQWLIATADYGNKGNEVRLYDPEKLKKAKKTSEPGILINKFKCGEWVQNLHWIDEKGILVLVQNQNEGKKWRLTFLDLEKSLNTGEASVLKMVDLSKDDELEGFALLGQIQKAIAVTAQKKDNASILELLWE
ncbi:MAG: hypothetical protein ACNS62_06240 [Candidatus Cyclobacteriaceae bacterium M3_2C_046]